MIYLQIIVVIAGRAPAAKVIEKFSLPKQIYNKEALATIRMNRRKILSTITGAFSLYIAGCSGSSTGSSGVSTQDPFPDDVEGAKRGGGDEPLIVTVQKEEGLSDGSIECANKASDPFHDYLPNKINVSEHVSTGYGKGPKGYDGMAIRVTLWTKVYNRDGEVMKTADIEYSSLVNASTPTVILQSKSGKHVCAVPVYVSRAEKHID